MKNISVDKDRFGEHRKYIVKRECYKFICMYSTKNKCGQCRYSKDLVLMSLLNK